MAQVRKLNVYSPASGKQQRTQANPNISYILQGIAEIRYWSVTVRLSNEFDYKLTTTIELMQSDKMAAISALRSDDSSSA